MRTWEIRPVTEEEWPAFVTADHVAFGFVAEEKNWDPARRSYPIERTFAAFDGEDIVGTAAAFEMELCLPGLTTVPATGVTWVGVLPTHRRKGVLTAMMRRQLEDSHERGEPVAILLASESVIYGRFGYGLATRQSNYRIDRAHASLVNRPASEGRVRLVDQDQAKKLYPDIHDRTWRMHHGDISRPEGWWNGNGFREKGRFYAVHEDGRGRPDGFATYQVKHAEGDFGRATVKVFGLHHATPAAYADLWQYVLDIDLSEKVEAYQRPLDEPLRHMLADPRRLETMTHADFLWARLVDLPTALAARRYAVDDALVIEVRDPFLPWNEGRYKLAGSPEGATCKPAKTKPDLVVGAADLGAALLGSTSFTTLARAARVEARNDKVLARADLMFRTSVEPWCGTGF